jgi:hypothetical protein
MSHFCIVPPLPQPASAQTEVSETLFVSACTAQQCRQAWADGVSSLCNIKHTELYELPNSEPCVRLPNISVVRGELLATAVRHEGDQS